MAVVVVEATNIDIQVYLPNDLIVNILSRLPCKSLLRFKCVCKSWCSLITHDTVFHSLHLSNSNSKKIDDLLWLAVFCTKDLCLYETIFWVYDPYPILQELLSPRQVLPSAIVGWCDGIVAIIQDLPRLGGLICLCNPSIRKFKKVFFPWNKITNKYRLKSRLTEISYRTGLMCCGLGLDLEREEYKFVTICLDSHTKMSHVFVYTLKTGKWTKINVEVKLIVPILFARGQKLHGLYVNGACHWIRTDERSEEDMVMSFDLSGHHLRYIDLPPKSPPSGHSDNYDEYFKIAVWKDMLSVFETTKIETMLALKIWVIKDEYSNSSSSSCSWTLIKTVYLKDKYWAKNVSTRYSQWPLIDKYIIPSAPLIDSLSDEDTHEMKKYLAPLLHDLAPFQESLLFPEPTHYTNDSIY